MNFICMHLRRSFFKILLVIGECAHDISASRFNQYNAIPWSTFNYLRNIIYHVCMDRKEGREQFSRVLLGLDKSIDFGFMQA